MARRVVVIGAGLAGLTAADLLVAAGCDVVVLEAADRVGGRAFTRADGFVDGQHAEAGAEWIDTVHERAHALIDRLGLRVDPNATTWTAVRRWLYRSGRLLGPDQLTEIEPTLGADLDRFEEALAAVAAGIVDPSRPQDHPRSADFDALSVAALVEQLELHQLARLFVTRNMQGEFAAEPSDVSVLFVAQQRAVYKQAGAQHGTIVAQRVLGGISGLTDGLAAALPPATIHVGQRVVGIDGWRGDGALAVRTSTDTFAADDVVIACSLVALRHVAVSPQLPDALRAAVDTLGYGSVTKTALQYEARAWPAGYATTEGEAQRVYEPTAAAAGTAGILMAYTGGDGGRRLGEMAEADRITTIERSQREMYPALPARVAGFSLAWSVEPLFGGSYAVYRPGEITRFWEILRQPYGRLHLAGEHTATWTGYLEGAIESGATVAARVLASG